MDKLTIGMAVFDDFDGAYFTLQSLHAHHPQVEYLVIDNAPQSDVRLRAVSEAVGGRYLHRPDLHGTSAPRDAIFRLARTPWAMCIDSHVLLETGAVQGLLDFIDKHPDCTDLLTGPLVYDDGKLVSTHWRRDDSTGGVGLWGTWDTDARGLDRNAPPFEIPMQGLGLFAMRCAVWPGFSPLFRGFGGEEGYIHETVRQRGGKNLCLPGLRWRHRFRDQKTAVPYRLIREDHIWNLLVGHRELGIDAVPQIRATFGKDIPASNFDELLKASEVQQVGVPSDIKRFKLLGIWYSNNAAPEKLLQRSLQTIQRAVSETMHHDVFVTTSVWQTIPGNPFSCVVGKPAVEGHAAIIAQMRACIGLASDYAFDAVVFLEHDVLYPPGHFDRIGTAFYKPGWIWDATREQWAVLAPVVSNLDYIGLNATGWLNVKERHEPQHQLAMRRDIALANLNRAQAEAEATGGCLLEPQGDRSEWVRLPFTGLAPAVHVNHPHRFTSHGEVVFESHSGGKTVHPFWGEHVLWWPLEVQAAPKGGCGSCGSAPQAPPPYATVAEWFESVQKQPSDFNEHMPVLKELAKDGVCIELSAWLKPAILAMAAGKPRELISVCHSVKPEWAPLSKLVAFRSVNADTLATQPIACDLLFIDTLHQADRLYRELSLWAPLCQHYIVVHCTETFGEHGDDGGPGVLPGLRRYMRENPQWSVVEHYRNNHGLTVLSCQDADKPTLPSTARKVWNFAKAMTSWKASGLPVLDQENAEARLDVCALCKLRSGDSCSKCGCPLVEGKLGVPGKAFVPTEECPLGKWPLAKPQDAEKDASALAMSGK